LSTFGATISSTVGMAFFTAYILTITTTFLAAVQTPI